MQFNNNELLANTAAINNLMFPEKMLDSVVLYHLHSLDKSVEFMMIGQSRQLHCAIELQV